MLREVKIFISSPNDLQEEHDICEQIIEEMNDLLSEKFQIKISWYSWKKATRSVGSGNPMQLTDRVENYDLYIGMMWKRFGTATGNINPATGEQYGSGTEEEFLRALNANLDVKFLRRTDNICEENFNEEDAAQYEKVKLFFKEFNVNSKHVGIYGEFDSRQSFSRYIRSFIFRHIYEHDKLTALYGHYKDAGFTDLFLKTDNDIRNASKRADLQKTANVKLIAHCGNSYLDNSVPRFYNEVHDCLARGGKAEIILANPFSQMGFFITAGDYNSNTTQIIDAIRNFNKNEAIAKTASAPWIRRKQEAALDGYLYLKELYPEQISLKMCKYEMNATILLTDNGAYLEPYMHGIGSERGMNLFEIRVENRTEPKNTYSALTQYFNLLWQISEDYESYLNNIESHKKAFITLLDSLNIIG